MTPGLVVGVLDVDAATWHLAELAGGFQLVQLCGVTAPNPMLRRVLPVDKIDEWKRAGDSWCDYCLGVQQRRPSARDALPAR